jgi:hypothetical protein
MGVNYLLLDEKNKPIAQGEDRACFALLSSERTLKDHLSVIHAQYGLTEQETAQITKVLYQVKIDDSLSKREVSAWIALILRTLEFRTIIPRQSVKSIMTKGFLVDGKKQSGVAIVTAMSLVRYLYEESHIVSSYFKIRKFPNMDNITALLLAHELTWRDHDERWVHERPNNINHTVFVGRLNNDVLKDTWTHYWKTHYNAQKPWAERREYKGVHAFFTPKGNWSPYDHSDLNKWMRGRHVSTELLVDWIEKHVYPLRAKTLGK